MTLTINIWIDDLAKHLDEEHDHWDNIGLSHPEQTQHLVDGWLTASWEVEDESETEEILELLTECNIKHHQ